MDQLLEIFLSTLSVLLGFLAWYFKHSESAQKWLANKALIGERIRTEALQYINTAENTYADSTKAGAKKFEYVVDKIAQRIPKPFQNVFSRAIISELVQSTFNEMEKFAMEQIDRKLGDGQ